MKLLNVVGARPNFVKVAPVHHAIARDGRFTSVILHTGQHYDARMSDVFFEQLGLPAPHVSLGVGSGTHAQQTAGVMTAFEDALARERPDLVLVYGDVNSTVACGLVAAKAGVPLAHVEAGLRSRDRRMPEEINRVVTDHLADLLFVTEQSGLDNLAAEGIPAGRVHFVGNVMIDTLLRLKDRALETTVPAALGVTPGTYALVTLHRPSNVDTPEGLGWLVSLLGQVAERCPVVFAVHPRTRANLARFGLDAALRARPAIHLLDPVGYLDFVGLQAQAAFLLTDSGGVQEETTALGVPCLTLRENTERPVTVTVGTNELVPFDPDAVLERVDRILAGAWKAGAVPPLWDGRAAERIVAVLGDVLLA